LLSAPWLAGGFVLAAALATVAAWRVREDDVAKIGLMTAAFFVASSLTIRLGPTSVHFLLNALVGVVLGWQAALAIPVGLFFQAALLQHGGFLSLGVNSCVMVLPALFAGRMFAVLHRLPGVRRPWFRSTLVAVSVLTAVLSLVYCLVLLFTNSRRELQWGPDLTEANAIAFHPAVLAGALALAILGAALERRTENAPEFPLGLLVGEVTVLLSVFLMCVALVWGGPERNLVAYALLNFIAYAPIAAFEGVALGYTVGFLARVKPEMLGWERPALEALPRGDNPPPAPAPYSRNLPEGGVNRAPSGPTAPENRECPAKSLP
jgi:cobalt/nickel transport system permease protein